ncbi:unnamed protein product [Moneuplotes crassus]|uniref:Uncharacterized protein n=1 Tax=Euplotes crassus TaxID=5936 RepID=A0AAD1X685_EUPCR|nr:unnamed protein product [Moneuplotes crassus]
MQSLALFESRRDKALRHILQKEAEIEQKKRQIEEKELEENLILAQKALEEKKLSNKATNKKIKSMLQKQEEEKFMIKTNKNEYKVEFLNHILDQEETRRIQDAKRKELDEKFSKKNEKYMKKLDKYKKKVSKTHRLKETKLQKKLEDINQRVERLKERNHSRTETSNEERLRQNKLKIEQQNKEKCEKLLQKLQKEEQNYEKMKHDLILATTEKPFGHKKDETDPKERIKLQRERLYLQQKEDQLIKLHRNEEILKQRQKARQEATEQLKIANEEKNKRKEMVKQRYLKKLEQKRVQFSRKLKREQKKAEEYEIQKRNLMENKYTNQMIDQMKIHYYKEMYYTMKINNKTGTKEFDKMTKNLVSIPKEDLETGGSVSKDRVQKRINSAFGFALNQFSNAKNIKPIRNKSLLALTQSMNSGKKTQKRTKGRSSASQGYLPTDIYSKNMTNSSKDGNKSGSAKKLKPVEEINQAKNIFITSNEDDEGVEITREAHNSFDKPESDKKEAISQNEEEPIQESSKDASKV